MATIQKITNRLSDGSEVFDVVIWDDGTCPVRFQAVTEDDADQFIRILTVAIENHTVDTVEVE